MKKLFSILIAAVLLLGAFALVGCGEKKKEIKIGYWINNANEKANNQKLFDAFERKFPDYKVVPVPISYDSYGEEVPRLHAGNTVPDVLWIREEYLPIFANKGLITPVDEMVNADPELDPTRYIDNALDFCTYGGKLYGLPRDIGVQVMAFNLDIMGNTPLPANDWTWNDMVELGKKFTVKSGSSVTQYGLGWLDWKSLIYSNGGELFTPDGKSATFNDPKTIEALQFYSDLANDPNLAIMPTAEASQGLGNPFLGKKAAFALIGPWDYAKLVKSNIRYDIRPFPAGPQGEGNMRLSGLSIGISSKTKNKEMAYELMKFLCYSDEAQTIQAESSIAMPSIKEIALSPAYTESTYAPPSIDVYFKALENTFIEPHFEGELEAIATFEDYLYMIYNKAGGTLVKAADIADEMNAAIQKVLNDYNK